MWGDPAQKSDEKSGKNEKGKEKKKKF